MRKILIVITIITALNFLAAQEKADYGWKKTMMGNLNFTQTQFSNWKQGGENSWTWQLDLNGKIVKDMQKYNWSNSFKISYGKSRVGEDDAKKAADEIRLESVYTYKLGVLLNPYVAVTGETQLTKGYNYLADTTVAVSQFLDPAYFTQSAGLGYEPVKNLKTRLGIALKQTIADSYAPLYSDDISTQKVEKIRSELGAESVTDLSRKVSDNILFTSKLELFSNLKRFSEVDVRWDNVFSAKISKYIAVSFNVKLFYDRDISKSRQLKQMLAAGLTYSFF